MVEPTISSGTVTDDPLRDADIGFQLNLRAITFPAREVQNFRDWTLFEGILLKVLFESDGQRRVHGSGVLIGPGIALVAKHVLEPEMDAVPIGQVHFAALAIAPHGLMIWDVIEAHPLKDSDIAILTMRLRSALPPGDTLKYAMLTTRLPPLEEAVSAVGFVAKAESFDSNAGIEGRVHVAQGLVLDHSLEGRPGLEGPSLCVGVGAPGGMSGGPVFDEAGALIGIVSKAIGSDADGTCAVSLVPPALVEPITPRWPTGLNIGQTCIRDFAKKLDSIEKPEAVDVRVNSDGTRNFVWETWS